MKKNKIEILINNDEYIKWLEDSIDRFSFFFDNERIDVDKYSLYDIENMKLLGEFYNFIDKYARKRIICPKSDIFGVSYVVKYGNNHYHVGIMNTPDLTHYCIRNIESEATVIEYEDLKNDVLCKETEYHNEKLEQLENHINVINENIRLEATESVCDDTIKKIK